VLEDLQSTNGTQVNGKRVRSAALADGDEIQIGKTLFRFAVRAG
jgi:pSer/pThr/pTyr-binding forkhead associated (FHA) protein